MAKAIQRDEAGRRTPPEYIPKLIAYQLKYEELRKKMEEKQDEK